jgi:nitrogen regulatory protein PII
MLWVSHHNLTSLVEETNDLASNVLPPGLLVVEDTGRGGKDDVTELTRRKQLDNPLLEITELDVVAGVDDTGLVETAVELDDDLAVAVVIDLLELANVTYKTC